MTLNAWKRTVDFERHLDKIIYLTCISLEHLALSDIGGYKTTTSLYMICRENSFIKIFTTITICLIFLFFLFNITSNNKFIVTSRPVVYYF